MKPALLLGLSASAAALNVNRRDALKGTTASVAQIALPTASLAQVALPNPALAATESKLALPKMGIGAWAWGDSLFWGYDPRKDDELREAYESLPRVQDGSLMPWAKYDPGRCCFEGADGEDEENGRRAHRDASTCEASTPTPTDSNATRIV